MNRLISALVFFAISSTQSFGGRPLHWLLEQTDLVIKGRILRVTDGTLEIKVIKSNNTNFINDTIRIWNNTEDVCYSRTNSYSVSEESFFLLKRPLIGAYSILGPYNLGELRILNDSVVVDYNRYYTFCEYLHFNEVVKYNQDYVWEGVEAYFENSEYISGIIQHETYYDYSSTNYVHAEYFLKNKISNFLARKLLKAKLLLGRDYKFVIGSICCGSKMD